MTTTTFDPPSTQKVRRDVAGGKRGDGNDRTRRIVRPDPGALRIGKPDRSLTSVGGLVAFGAFVREEGIDRALRKDFDSMKEGDGVIYPMAAQLRLLMDLFVLGEPRVFALEALAADPLFVRLAGGVVPSLDTVYRDLARFGEATIKPLEETMATQGLRPLRGRRLREVHLDIDTTVEPLFGDQEGALPGSNPRYHGRPSYHPVLARVAETGTCVGAWLRSGDTSFGDAEAPLVDAWLARVRPVIGPSCVLYVRIDSAGDCAAIFEVVDKRGAFFDVKARMTPDLCETIATLPERHWTSVDWDAEGHVLEQVATIPFQRASWGERGARYRVVAVRSRKRDDGKRLYLWNHLDYTVQAYVTNDTFATPEEVAARYAARAGIEPQIAEWKGAWGIGAVPTRSFDANHATLVLKLLTHNLLRRFVLATAPVLRAWRASWIRRVLINVPGRLVRSGGRWTLRLPPRPLLN